MRKQFVKTNNWNLFQLAVTALNNVGSDEAKIMLLSGEPGSGKTRVVDKFGAESNAVLLQGMPGMTVAFTVDYLADRLNVNESRNYAKFNEIVNQLRKSGSPIILDEAQHSADGKARPLELLRRVAEQAKVMLILVCHTTERNRFTEHRMAHINSRISAAPVFGLASHDDCALYLKELCEIDVDAEIVNLVMEQSQKGRYRLINNAIKSLETLAAQRGKTSLAIGDLKKVKLCENVMEVLVPSMKKGAS